MIDVEIIQVPHLGGIEASYKLSHPYDPQKPTVVLIAPFSMPLDIFSSQFEDDALKDAVNVLAIDPLGQGRTQTLKTDEWNYWDTARMNLQVLEGLHVEKAFSMGSSQGGWIAVQMALLEPDKVGIYLSLWVGVLILSPE